MRPKEWCGFFPLSNLIGDINCSCVVDAVTSSGHFHSYKTTDFYIFIIYVSLIRIQMEMSRNQQRINKKIDDSVCSLISKQMCQLNVLCLSFD